MQATLLGLGIAIIVALVAALVGPAYVDWGEYRSTFEAQASRLAGQPVRIAGAIDVRLLPTPTIGLREIEIDAPARPKLAVRALNAELSLGALMRGEWRASVVRLEGPQVTLGLDATGALVGPALALDQLTIDRLDVQDARIVVSDATSGTRFVLAQASFRGEVRSLAGPIKGEGAFRVNDQPYSYRIATGRKSEDGIKLRVGLDPADQPLTIESEGTLAFERGAPRYEGTAAIARPAGLALSNGGTVASEPWRIFGRVKGDVGSALFEQVELQYGPDERAIRLAGTAELKLGARPRLAAVLSARQIDLDRALADASNRRPLAVLRALAQSMGAALRPPLELGIGIGVDAVTLGGAALQSVRADFAGDGQAWTVERLEVRAPGSTQVRLSGRLDAHDFVGSLAIEAVDPATLVAWLGASQPSQSSQRAIGPLRLRGEVTLGRERWAIERASAEYDRQAIEGRLAYVLSAGDRPARLEAALRAAEFDLDGALALAKNALVGAGLERPGEIALAVDFGRVTFAGITAKAATADIRLDAAGLSIERLAVADFGGAALTGSGRIDLAAPPHGAIALGLEARSIDGLAALLAPFAPKAADLMRRSAAQVSPATLNASFKIDPPAQSGAAATIGRLTLDGRLGGVRVTLSAEGHGDIAALSDLRIAGRATSEDGALATLLGLGGVAGARGPVSLNIAAHGPAGELGVTAALSGEGLQADARGMLRLNDREPGGSFDLSFAASDVRMLARDGPLPVSFTSRVALAGRDLILRDLAGNVGAAAVRGELTVALDPLRVGGKIAADRIDLPAVIATAIGMPRASGALPTQTLVLPFAGIAGRIAFEADEARLAPAIVARKLRGTAGFGPTELTFDNVAGILGAGGLSADAAIRSGAGGLSARARLAISNAEAAALLGSRTVRGRVSARFEVEGVGPSAAALIGSLNGTGAVTLEGAEIAGLDAKAIDVAIRAAERAAPIAPARLADLVNRALDVGSLAVPWASAPVTISAGRARLGKLVTPPQTNDFAVTGGVDLVEGAIDLRVTLFGPPSGSAQRPDVSVVLKGPIGAPRRAVDVSALAEWLTLQAVDREAKRLEAAEQAAKRLQAAEEAAKRVEAAEVTASTPVLPAAAAAQAAPLPPPIDIGPPAGERGSPRPASRALPLPLVSPAR